MSFLMCWLKALLFVSGGSAFLGGIVAGIYGCVKLGDYIDGHFRSPWCHVLTVLAFLLLASIPVTVAICMGHK